MKVLLTIKSLQVRGGGAERVLVDVANYLYAHNINVSVATFDSPGEPVFYDLNPNIKIRHLGFGQPAVPTSGREFIKAIPRIRKTIKAVAPDLLIGFMHSTYVPLGLALLGTSHKIITSEHVGYQHFQHSKVQDLLAKFIRSRAIATTVPATQVKESYPDTEHSDIFVLPNPLDLSPYLGASPLAEDNKRILCVGRFMEEKDHTTLFEAFAGLSARFPDWTLKCVGDGVMRQALEQKVTALGLEDRISMPGYNAAVAQEYEASAIVAIPSKYESFGMVAVEALASGRPVIGFDDTGGLTNIITHNQNGWLVSPGGDRVAAYQKGLAQLMSNFELRSKLAQNGPQSVMQFQSEQVLPKWLAFLKDRLS